MATFCLFVAPWSWQLRAQALALPLFILVLELASADVRRPTPRMFLALPLVALWANIHGSVLLGAGMVSLAGWHKPVAEPEIAVHMGRDLPGAAGRATAIAAIAALGPAIELAGLLPGSGPGAIPGDSDRADCRGLAARARD